MYLTLLEKYESEVLRGKKPIRDHLARFDFAIWLENHAAQQSAQPDGDDICPDCKQVSSLYRCESCGCQWSPRR